VTPTVAELIAAALGHDGTCWATPDGVVLDDLIDLHGGRITVSHDSWRAVFADGSAITVSGGAAWDIGYAGCWCWAGHGHENCTAGEG
jgi:hypothetical protein